MTQGPTVSREVEPAEPSRDELLARYAAYRRRQARGVLHMLPRQAVRPLYRRALAADGGGEASDPMESLVSYCERLLPLPPFTVWLEDVRQNPEAHLHAVEDAAGAPSPDAPVTFETREFSVGSDLWAAHLRSFRDGDSWRGFIAFEHRGARRIHRTALIFNEADPVDVRDRFMSFDAFALAAFLRSALP